MFTGFPRTRWPRLQFSESNVVWISVKISRICECYNGNNDRSAQVLFIQHPREQGEWLRQNPHYARVLTASFALFRLVLDEQHPRSPVIIPKTQPMYNQTVHIFYGTYCIVIVGNRDGAQWPTWTHLPLDKMAAISQTICSDLCIFVNEKFCIFIIAPKDPIDNNPALVWIMLGAK